MDNQNKLKDIVADYVVDYPRFEEPANEVAELILDVVRERLIEAVKKALGDQVLNETALKLTIKAINRVFEENING